MIEYTKRVYLSADETRERKPINQFLSLKSEIAERSAEEVDIDRLKTSVLRQISRNLLRELCGITTDRVLRTARNSFVAYRVICAHGGDPGAQEPAKGSISKPIVTLSGVAVFVEKNILLGAVGVRSIVDLEEGVLVKQLWDVFQFDGRRYMLTSVQDYESYSFELYQFDNTDLTAIASFEFGGL